MSYASDMIRELLAAGPYEGEDFYRCKLYGRGSTNWFNATSAQAEAIAAILDDEPEPFTPELCFYVGVTETCQRIARFDTAEHASAFIGLLPEHEQGVYYIDGPEVAS